MARDGEEERALLLLTRRSSGINALLLLLPPPQQRPRAQQDAHNGSLSRQEKNKPWGACIRVRGRGARANSPATDADAPGPLRRGARLLLWLLLLLLLLLEPLSESMLRVFSCQPAPSGVCDAGRGHAYASVGLIKEHFVRKEVFELEGSCPLPSVRETRAGCVVNFKLFY